MADAPTLLPEASRTVLTFARTRVASVRSGRIINDRGEHMLGTWIDPVKHL